MRLRRGHVTTLHVEGQQGMPAFSYTTPFQYGAQVRNNLDYNIHEYIDQQKLATFKTPFDSPYPIIDIDLKYLKILCEDSEDKNKGDVNGQTALHALCLYGSINALKIMLEAGADLGCEDHAGFSVAHYCAMSDRADLLAYLDRSGVSITKQALGTSRTPLHIASICNSVDCVKYLLNSGVNCNQLDNYGYSPLWLAVYYRNDAICLLLSRNGAQINVTEVDKVSFVFRTVEKCAEYGEWLLNSYITSCQYRGVSCIWLNKLVNGVSYENTDLTHPYLYLTSPKREFIEHPVIRSYTKAAWAYFGRRAAARNLTLYLIFSLLWTLHFMTDNGKTFRDKSNVGKIIAYSLLLPFTCYIIYDMFVTLRCIYKKQLICLESEMKLVNKEIDNVHPCMWYAYLVLLREKKGLSKKLLHLKIRKFLSQQYIELLIMLLSAIVLVLEIAMAAVTEDETRKPRLNVAYIIFTSSILILVWMDTFFKFRYFKEFGAFLVSVKHLTHLLAKFAVMFVMFYIPIACIFWKTIYESAERNHSPGDLSSDSDNSTRVAFPDAFYRVYRMTFGDYSYSEGLNIATKISLPSWWNVLTFYWMTVGGIILLKILGAMVFAVISEPLQESQFTAYKERLYFICEVVMNQSSSKRQEFARHLELDCNPFVREGELVRDVKSEGREVEEEIARINTRLNQLTGHMFGEREMSASSSSVMNI